MLTIERFLSLTMSALLVIGGVGCEPGTNGLVDSVETPFDHPQDLLFAGSLLIVTNTGYSSSQWRPGYLSVIDVEQGKVIHQISTSRLNPQRLKHHNGQLLSINTGSYDLSDFDRPTTDTPGSIDGFTLAQLTTLNEPSWTLELDTSLIAPADIAFSGQTALMSSSIRPSYLMGTLDRSVVLAGEGHELPNQGSLSLVAVKSWREHFLLIDFNSDQLSLVDHDGQLLCQLELGRRVDEMEGAMSPQIQGDNLYILLALSGELRRVDLSRILDTCEADIETVVSPLGQVPNHLIIRDNRAFIVHSGDNHVAEFDLTSGAEVRRWVMPVSSNPWSAAISDDGQWLAVTKWAHHGVTIINLQNERRREVEFGFTQTE